MIARAELPSIWSRDVEIRRPPKLTTAARADVCIIGAGIAGLTAAKLLASDRSVIVLDTDYPGSGETGVTTAHLSNEIDDRYAEIVRLHGREGARLACESHRAAIERIEAICHLERMACEYARVDGYLFLAPDHLQTRGAAPCAKRRTIATELAHEVMQTRTTGLGYCLEQSLERQRVLAIDQQIMHQQLLDEWIESTRELSEEHTQIGQHPVSRQRLARRLGTHAATVAWCTSNPQHAWYNTSMLILPARRPGGGLGSKSFPSVLSARAGATMCGA